MILLVVFFCPGKNDSVVPSIQPGTTILPHTFHKNIPIARGVPPPLPKKNKIKYNKEKVPIEKIDRKKRRTEKERVNRKPHIWTHDQNRKKKRKVKRRKKEIIKTKSNIITHRTELVGVDDSIVSVDLQW